MAKTFLSDISGRRYNLTDRVAAESIRPSLVEMIRSDHPSFNEASHISMAELNHYREKYISDFLRQETGKISELDRKVVESITEKTIISDYTDEDQPTMGERMADRVASFGGSWTFILSFMSFLLIWIFFNAFILLNKGFDPYPFILLNLILSCLAAIQAPIIMMSQNRQESKDRERAREDYMVNLKAELEVKSINEKLDHVMMHQQQELIEIQKIQIDMLRELAGKVNRLNNRESKKRTQNKQTPL